MNITDRTKELTSILCDKYHMQKSENEGAIYLQYGRLMGLPVCVWIHPEFGRARFFVTFKSGIGGVILNIDLQYVNRLPIGAILDAVIEKFIYAVNELRKQENAKSDSLYFQTHFRNRICH